MKNLETHWLSPANLNKQAVSLIVVATGLLWTLSAEAQSMKGTFDCVMEPGQTAKIGSPVVGVLEGVDVARGDVVTVGQVIARLRSEVEAAALEVNRARAESRTRIEAQEVRVGLNQRRFDRAKQLQGKGVIPQNQYDEIEAELNFSLSELSREQQDQELAALEYNQSKAVLDQRIIKSPIAGVISEKLLSAGEFVRQDAHVVTVASLDPLNVEVFLPVEMYPHVNIGMTGTIIPAAPISGEYSAQITVVDKVFDAASSSFGVRLSLPNPQGYLPGGHRCKVRFETQVNTTQQNILPGDTLTGDRLIR